MRYSISALGSAIFLGTLLLAATAQAQNGLPKLFRDWLPSTNPTPESKTEIAPADPFIPRDPTEAQGELKQLLTQPNLQTNQPTAPSLPSLRVQAKVIGAQGPMALLSVGEKGSLFIQPGTTFSVPDFPGTDVKVLRIAREGIELEFLPMNRRLLLP
jgi:hypothetical protein